MYTFIAALLIFGFYYFLAVGVWKFYLFMKQDIVIDIELTEEQHRILDEMAREDNMTIEEKAVELIRRAIEKLK